TARQIVEELYLRTYSRYPTDEEYETVLPLFAAPAPKTEAVSAAVDMDGAADTDGGAAKADAKADAMVESKDPAVRRRAAEDLLWALINTPEFVFQN